MIALLICLKEYHSESDCDVCSIASQGTTSGLKLQKHSVLINAMKPIYKLTSRMVVNSLSQDMFRLKIGSYLLRMISFIHSINQFL